MDTANLLRVDVSKHTKFLWRCLDLLPEFMSTMDSIRTTLLFFGIHGLSTLQQLDAIKSKKAAIIEWIYGLQTRYCKQCGNLQECGFKGSYSLGNSVSSKIKCQSNPDSSNCANHTCAFAYNDSHLAGTYTALSILLLLGDDFSQVDRAAILNSLRYYQLDNGSFKASAKLGTESDVRFVYCACVIAFILDAKNLRRCAKNAMDGFDESRAEVWSLGDSRCSITNENYYFDIRQTVQFLLTAQTYEGGFAQQSGAETHGGSTYCAVAALNLLGLLNDRRVMSPRRLSALRRWLARRQPSAFAGRVNKEADSCYTFWIGATLHMLESADTAEFKHDSVVAQDGLESVEPVQNFYKVNIDALCSFLSDVQDTTCGGFRKCLGAHSDPMHTCLVLVGLSTLMRDEQHSDDRHSALRTYLSDLLQAVNPALNISKSAYEHLLQLQANWSISNAETQQLTCN